jgi:hypothetical protein
MRSQSRHSERAVRMKRSATALAYVFARLHDADAFFTICRRMRLEGAKRLEIARA